ncbi:MAG: queuosine precursor transporter [Kiritimatiellae bacterium]|nr:queuosine precursor transporter [Kiritimatiellia bacterium]
MTTIAPTLPNRAERLPLAALLVTAAYIAAQMLSDIASLKIGVVAGLAVDMGTFVYPLTFTLRDLLHRETGRRGARAIVLAAGVINLAMAGYLRWAAAVPADPSWGLGREFAAILGPVWRIVLASIAAEVLSELADTEVYHWFVTRVTRRHPWARVLVSNVVAVPLDNLVFCLGAFGGVLPSHTILEIFTLNLAVKGVVTLASIPLIWLARDRGPHNA